MPRVRSRNAHQHVSDFHKGQIEVYRYCGLLHRSIADHVSRDPMTVCRIWRALMDHVTSPESRIGIVCNRRILNGVINDEPGRKNGETSFFQMNPGSVDSIKMVASMFDGIVVNARWKRAFVIAILAHQLA
ncbi:hypothetical protein TNCV_3603841 [Trichonephila clavipes]|nr:hypothetical protein TNCV_3603841 [Trichonephila clavipes]